MEELQLFDGYEFCIERTRVIFMEHQIFRGEAEFHPWLWKLAVLYEIAWNKNFLIAGMYAISDYFFWKVWN